MTTLFAASEALKTTIALIVIFGVAFPALVTGLIVYAAVVAKGESTQNNEHRRFPRL